jgi:hypothetical protein
VWWHATAAQSTRSSAALACRDVADNAFRLMLDASPDGLSVLGWQRLPGCEQQRVLPGVRMEPRLLRRVQRQCAHVRGLHGACSEREPVVRRDEHRHTLRAIPISTRHAAAAAAAAAACATIAIPASALALAAPTLALAAAACAAPALAAAALAHAHAVPTTTVAALALALAAAALALGAAAALAASSNVVHRKWLPVRKYVPLCR